MVRMAQSAPLAVTPRHETPDGARADPAMRGCLLLVEDLRIVYSPFLPSILWLRRAVLTLVWLKRLPLPVRCPNRLRYGSDLVVAVAHRHPADDFQDLHRSSLPELVEALSLHIVALLTVDHRWPGVFTIRECEGWHLSTCGDAVVLNDGQATPHSSAERKSLVLRSPQLPQAVRIVKCMNLAPIPTPPLEDALRLSTSPPYPVLG